MIFNRRKSLRIGAVAAVFMGCISPISGAGTEFPPRAIRELAAKCNLDILYVYGTDDGGAAGKFWMDALGPSGAAAGQLSQRFVICRVDLPAAFKKGDRAVLNRMLSAMNHGVYATPAMVLCDSGGKAYTRVFGGARNERELQSSVDGLLTLAETKKRRDELLKRSETASGAEKSSLILAALETVPRECWFRDYPAQVAALSGAGCTNPGFVAAAVAADRNGTSQKILDIICSLPERPDRPGIDEALSRMNHLIETEGLDCARRQHLLLTVIYPLYVNKAALLYEGANTGELETAFNQSIDVLERVRDMDRDSQWGRQAHALREELRKARLAAAKYD